MQNIKTYEIKTINCLPVNPKRGAKEEQFYLDKNYIQGTLQLEKKLIGFGKSKT